MRLRVVQKTVRDGMLISVSGFRDDLTDYFEQLREQGIPFLARLGDLRYTSRYTKNYFRKIGNISSSIVYSVIELRIRPRDLVLMKLLATNVNLFDVQMGRAI